MNRYAFFCLCLLLLLSQTSADAQLQQWPLPATASPSAARPTLSILTFPAALLPPAAAARLPHPLLAAPPSTQTAKVLLQQTLQTVQLSWQSVKLLFK